MSLHKHSLPLPSAPKKLAKSAKLQNSLLAPKYKAKHFPNNFYASGEYAGLHIVSHNVGWNRVDALKHHVQSEVHVNYKANTAPHTPFKGKISENRFRSLETELNKFGENK